MNFKIQPDKQNIPKWQPRNKQDIIINEAIQRMLKADDPDLWQSKQAEQDSEGVYVRTRYKGFYVEVHLIAEYNKAMAMGAAKIRGQIVQFNTGMMDTPKEAMFWLTKMIDKFRLTNQEGKENEIILIN